jgi:hypothetical protein
MEVRCENPTVKKEYEKLAPEFKLAKSLIRARMQKAGHRRN